MHRDPHIFPKIVEVTNEYHVDPAAVIALIAINALADSDLGSLSFWADLADTTWEDSRRLIEIFQLAA